MMLSTYFQVFHTHLHGTAACTVDQACLPMYKTQHPPMIQPICKELVQAQLVDLMSTIFKTSLSYTWHRSQSCISQCHCFLKCLQAKENLPPATWPASKMFCQQYVGHACDQPGSLITVQLLVTKHAAVTVSYCIVTLTHNTRAAHSSQYQCLGVMMPYL